MEELRNMTVKLDIALCGRTGISYCFDSFTEDRMPEDAGIRNSIEAMYRTLDIQPKPLPAQLKKNLWGVICDTEVRMRILIMILIVSCFILGIRKLSEIDVNLHRLTIDSMFVKRFSNVMYQYVSRFFTCVSPVMSLISGRHDYPSVRDFVESCM
jgi:hypothetical protein